MILVKTHLTSLDYEAINILVGTGIFDWQYDNHYFQTANGPVSLHQCLFTQDMQQAKQAVKRLEDLGFTVNVNWRYGRFAICTINKPHPDFEPIVVKSDFDGYKSPALAICLAGLLAMGEGKAWFYLNYINH